MHRNMLRSRRETRRRLTKYNADSAAEEVAMMIIKGASALLLLACVVGVAGAQTKVTQNGAEWRVENAALRVSVQADRGQFSVLDKRCGYLWKNPEAVSFPIRNVQPTSDGVRFETDLPLTNGRTGVIGVVLRVPNKSSEIHVTAEAQQPDSPFASMAFLPPLVLDTPQGALAVADYCNGHLYPLDAQPFPARWLSLDRLDMPWVGVCDLQRGFGYALIVQTADDGFVTCEHYRVGERSVVAPRVGWWAQKGKFAYPRQMVYHFSAGGGYVALAKAYRAHAKAQGLLVTLREKAKRNPNLHKLFGSADVWGVWGVDYVQFVEEAKRLGISKLLLHGTASPEAMRKAVEAGYLTSEYDNYTDVMAVDSEDKVDSTHDLVPANVVLKGDGERLTAWRTMEGQQYMKRCPALWLRTAKPVIPKALRQYPFVGRFIDVTTAEALYECYDPNHPLTRSDKRRMGEELLAYVRSLGLVVGGEHGIWWGVPHHDYIEGMMSSYQFSWPAGHLIRPQSKEQTFTDPWGRKLPPWSDYEKWGIGHEYRVPLWELVFHDCVVSTWYWGDATDFLMQADPDNMPRKDLFNILYGTIPLMWLEPQGAWHRDRQAFVRTYRITTKLHEAVAMQEMLSHEFLTPDRAVQRTRFADGTTAVVNFGEKPYALKVGKRSVVLPRYGFWVKGPRIEQSRLLTDGVPVTEVRASGFWFRETPTEWVFLRRIGTEHLQLEAFAKSARVRVDLHKVAPRWDRKTTLVYRLSSEAFKWVGDGQVELKVDNTWERRQYFDILCGKRTSRPDVSVSLQVPHQTVVQGKPLPVSMTIRNLGYAPARDVQVSLYADRRSPQNRLWQGRVSLGARSETVLRVNVPTARVDGDRLLIAWLEMPPRVQEISRANNRAIATVQVTRDLKLWDYRQRLKVEAGSLEREDEVVVVPIESPLFAPESVRVYLTDEGGRPLREVPAQCDRLEDGRMEMVFVVPGKMPAGSVRWVALHAMRKVGRVLPPRASEDVYSTSPVILRETYTTKLRDGVPRDLASVERSDSVGQPFISQMVFSSERTGWVEERGIRPPQVQVLAHGPVRTVLKVRRELEGNVTYTKRYTFYPKYFDVDIETSTNAGTYSRAFYSQTGEYEDSGAVKARVDGRGEAEGVLGTTQSPRWYAVYASRWAHACLALTPMDVIVYWDSAAMGGIGFNTGRTRDVRLRYVVLPGARDPSFAEWWYRRAMEPIKVMMAVD